MRSFSLTALSLVATLLTAATYASTQKDASVSVAHTVMELRQYVLHPGQRDALVDVFERNFIEGQEACGMRIIGTFRDLDDPDRFVWLRSFTDMPTRAAALNAFYNGPVWKAHSRVANSTMVDSDNVLLLRPARPTSGIRLANSPLPPPAAQGTGRGLIVGSIVYIRPSTPGEFVDFFEKELKPLWERSGASVVMEWATDPGANNFPALPVREGESVFVWFSVFPDQAALDAQRRALTGSAEWRVLAGKLSLWTHQPIETLRLQPTARSRLHSP